MLSALLISLVALPAVAAAEPMPAADAPVRVWLSRTDVVWPGDRIKVYAEARGDGFLIVLHAEPDGRIRVLFPIDPIDDYFVRGGSRYEVLSRGDREAITVYAREGVGTVLAAFSRDPFRLEEFTRGGHWDYQLPDAWWVNEDPEADLVALADRMAGGIRFDYDVQRYGVAQTVAAYRSRRVYYGYDYPTYVYPASAAYLSVGFTFGVPYFAYSYAHPVCWDWYHCYPGPWYYYTPYAYYRPFYYGHHHHYYYGYARYPTTYYPYYPYYPKYTGKSTVYRPDAPGVDYRRRAVAGTGRTVDPRTAAPGVGRRTPAAGTDPRVVAPRGEPGRRTTPQAGTPTTGGRRPVPAGAREAPQQREAGRRTGGERPATARPAPVTPTRPVSPAPALPRDETRGRRDAPAAGSDRRPEAARPAGNLPERVVPSRNPAPSTRDRGSLRPANDDRGSSALRPTPSRGSAPAARPTRVVPTRSAAPASRWPTRSELRAPARQPTRAVGGRSVSAGGRISLPTRVQSGAIRSAPRVSRPQIAPRAPRPSTPRAPARRAPSPRGRR